MDFHLDFMTLIIVKHVKSVFHIAHTVPHIIFSIVNYILMQSVSTAKRFKLATNFVIKFNFEQTTKTLRKYYTKQNKHNER